MDNFYAPIRSVYATPQQVKATLSTSNNALGQVIASVSDDLLMFFCEAASQKIDEFCAPRVFYPYYKSSIYDWPGTSFELPFRDDLLSLTSLINGDGTTIQPTTTIGNNTLTSYFFYPPDALPKFKIQLNVASGYVFLFINTPQQAITLNGIFGYPYNETMGLWKTLSGATVQDNPQSNVSTTLTVPHGYLQAGQTVYIESEFQIIQSIATGLTNDTCTVLRGANGSTAVAHVQGTAVYRIPFHPVIQRACNRMVQWYFRQKDAADFGKLSIAAPAFGMIEIPAGIPVDVQDDLLPLCKTKF